jgi:4-carboxymuconolactone decarboxylase
MEYRHVLCLLSLRDRAFFTLVDADESDNLEMSGLGEQQVALVRFAALATMDGAVASYVHAVENALAAGITADELVGTLIAIMPVTGGDRVVSAAPKLGLALGHDVEAQLEATDP